MPRPRCRDVHALAVVVAGDRVGPPRDRFEVASPFVETETMSTPRPVPIEDLLAQRDWVRRLARGLVEGAEDRDDVEQETWLRALRRPPQPGGSLRGWFSRVARSVRIDAHRADTQRRLREMVAARAEAQDVGDVVAQAESFRRVVEVAYALEEPLRTVVLLRYFEELTIPEIARKLTLKEEAVRSRLRRALARMRDRLDVVSGGDRSAWIGAVTVVAGLERRTRPLGRATTAATAVVGGVLMSGAKSVAAVVVLAVLAWWAFRGTETPTAPGASGASSSAELAVTVNDGRPPARRARMRADTPELAASGGDARPADGESASAVATALIGPRDAADVADLRDVTRQVVDERGAAVAGAGIRILRPEGASLVDVGASATVSTDEAGSFTAKVPRTATNLVVRVSSEGFVDADAALVEGEGVLRVQLQPAWTLRGVVVAKETSEGVPGATVVAFRAGTHQVAGAAVTDAAGAFAVAGLPLESLDVSAEEPTEVSVAAALALGAVSGDVTTARTPQFAPARVTGVPPRSGELRIEFLSGRTIEGTLVDASGGPVREQVELSVIGQTPQGSPDYTVRRSQVVCDERGAFRVHGLAEGLYDLSFVPSATAEGKSGAEGPLGAARVSRVAAGTTDLRVVLSAGATLHIRVVDPDGKPVEGGYVYVSTTGTMPGAHGTVVAPAGPDGTLVTAPLDREKTFDLLATGFAGYLQAKRERLRPGGEEVVVTLERGGSVTGRVIDEEGRAVGAGVPVNARAQGDVAPRAGTGWTAYTDAVGAFVLEALGDHAFTLAAGGGDSGLVAVAQVRDVRVARTDLVLRVRRGVTLTGRLRDADGKPVRTHLLAAAPTVPDGTISPTTRIDGDDGRFVFRGVHPGRVRLRCFVGDRFVDLGECDAPATDVELVLPGQ